MDCTKEQFPAEDPARDIYYASCGHYHVSEMPLLDALSYLVAGRVAELLAADASVINPVRYLINGLLGCSGYPVPSLMRITWSSFQHVGKPVDEESKRLFLETLEVVCKARPELIELIYIERASKYGVDAIVKILVSYYAGATEGPECFICYSNHTYRMLPSPCGCNTVIHLRCLVQLVANNGDQCTVCRRELGSSIDCHGRISFPLLDIYPTPLHGGQYTIADTLPRRIHYAIAYLCVERVASLFAAVTKEEYQAYYRAAAADCYALHRRDKDTGALLLRDMPYTNLSRRVYAGEFFIIEAILAEIHEQYK